MPVEGLSSGVGQVRVALVAAAAESAFGGHVAGFFERRELFGQRRVGELDPVLEEGEFRPVDRCLRGRRLGRGSPRHSGRVARPRRRAGRRTRAGQDSCPPACRRPLSPARRAPRGADGAGSRVHPRPGPGAPARPRPQSSGCVCPSTHRRERVSEAGPRRCRVRSAMRAARPAEVGRVERRLFLRDREHPGAGATRSPGGPRELPGLFGPCTRDHRFRPSFQKCGCSPPLTRGKDWFCQEVGGCDRDSFRADRCCVESVPWCCLPLATGVCPIRGGGCGTAGGSPCRLQEGSRRGQPGGARRRAVV